VVIDLTGDDSAPAGAAMPVRRAGAPAQPGRTSARERTDNNPRDHTSTVGGGQRAAYYVSSDFSGRKWPLLLPPLFLYALREGCSFEATELLAACTITVSMLSSILRSSTDLSL
jgi:hypothetical protein